MEFALRKVPYRVVWTLRGSRARPHVVTEVNSTVPMEFEYEGPARRYAAAQTEVYPDRRYWIVPKVKE